MEDDSKLAQLGKAAKQASLFMSQATTAQKNKSLDAIADALERRKNAILTANSVDVAAAEANDLDQALIDRLSLEGRLDGMIADVRKISTLPDPIGEVIEDRILPNGLHLSKKRTAIGVLGVIYEARPNVTVDVASLAIKSGNCAILRGGSETLGTNLILIHTIQEALKESGLPEHTIQMVDTSDRELVGKLLRLHQYIDLIIPRGGAGLHQFCRENSSIPVVTGGIGICHLFVDLTADVKKAVEVIHNAKTQRPTVCNALDTLLVHAEIAERFIPLVIERLGKSKVSFRLDESAWKIGEGLADQYELRKAGPEDWDTEWLSLVLGIKVVKNIEEAITHIQHHSTAHSDGILTENIDHAGKFIDEVDSAAVYVNASTRFTDGGEFGLGAEIAVSTQKLHARGPMGLKELTSYKWVAKGNYHIRK